LSNYGASDPKDVELESLILRRIREMGDDIHVSVKGGYVTLTGAVDEFEVKRDVEEAVKEISGVQKVTNNIRVAPIAD
jgi:osmotically-inducible protein OsmY